MISGRSKWLSLPVHLSMFLPSASIWSPVYVQSTPHTSSATYNSIFRPPVWHNRLSPSWANDVICWQHIQSNGLPNRFTRKNSEVGFPFTTVIWLKFTWKHNTQSGMRTNSK
jgi:hypothetical protein